VIFPSSRIPKANAAIEALTGPQDAIAEHNLVYQRRRDRILATLRQIGIEARTPQAGLYIWAHVPQGYTSASFATELLETVGVVVTPGTGYGPNGEGYINYTIQPKAGPTTGATLNAQASIVFDTNAAIAGVIGSSKAMSATALGISSRFIRPRSIVPGSCPAT
jgi:hypothetical protein